MEKRGVGVVLIAVDYHFEGKKVLVTQRVDNISQGGLWCLPCGHLEYDETGMECAVRETLEETGLKFPVDGLDLYELDTSPETYNQNVIIRYITAEPYKKVSGPNSDEVKGVKWITLKEIDDYKWAFGHGELIKRVLETTYFWLH